MRRACGEGRRKVRRGGVREKASEKASVEEEREGGWYGRREEARQGKARQ